MMSCNINIKSLISLHDHINSKKMCVRWVLFYSKYINGYSLILRAVRFTNPGLSQAGSCQYSDASSVFSSDAISDCHTINELIC